MYFQTQWRHNGNACSRNHINSGARLTPYPCRNQDSSLQWSKLRIGKHFRKGVSNSTGNGYFMYVYAKPVSDNYDEAHCRLGNAVTRSRVPGCKVHGANMGPIWSRQDQGGSHVGPINLLSGASFHCQISPIRVFALWYNIYFRKLITKLASGKKCS